IKMQREIDNDSESEKEVKDSTIMRRYPGIVSDIPVVPKLEIPFSVKDIISKIEQAQLHRAREDIHMQLADIMNNVHRIITRFTAVDLNAPSGRSISSTEYKKKWRTDFLEKMATYAKTAEIREKTLAYILAWLEKWNVILSEMTVIDVDEHHHWIAQMEMLPDTFKAIENNVKILTRISTSLLEEKKKQKKEILSRSTLWKSWKERVIKRPATARALRPDQMISDQFATDKKVSEIQDMLQELIGTAMFTKLENHAIKYISSTIINLSKALSVLNDELKVTNFQSVNMDADDTRETEKELFLRIIQDLSEENEMLQRKLQDAEEKCEKLIQSKVVTAYSTSSDLKVLPGLSSQSSMPITKDGDTEDSVDSMLAKEFENIEDEVPQRGIKVSGIKWDSAISYRTQVEMAPDLTEQQYPLPEKKRKRPSEDTTEDITEANISLKKGDVFHYQSQKRRHPYVHESSGSNLSDNKGEWKVSEAKLNQYPELQALEKKRKEIKLSSEDQLKLFTESKSQHFPSPETKSQGGKSGTSSMWEQLRKLKTEYALVKSPIPSETKVEPITESMDKERKSETSRMIQFDSTSKPQKVKIKGQKYQISSGTTTSKERKIKEKEILSFTKQVKSHQLVKSQSRIAKETSESTRGPESPDGKSEQSNLEEFQNAIMAFLKEKIDNVGKPFDKKTVLKEEELLKRAEVEKLRTIKAKMEEYFQKVAETVTKTLKKYKYIKKEGQVGEKPMKTKKVVPFTPGLHFQKSPISSKSEISTFLSSESTDPIINNLTQMILAEIENETDVPTVSILEKDDEEKEREQQEEYLKEGEEKMSGMSIKHQLQKEKNLLKKTYKMRNKHMGKKTVWLQMKEGEQEQQEQKQWQEEEVWKEQQKQRIPNWIEQDKMQKQMEKEEEEHQKPKQQLEAWEQNMKEQGVLLEKENREKMRQVQEEVTHLEQNLRWEKEEEKPRTRREEEDLTKQQQDKAKKQTEIEEKNLEELAKPVTQTTMTLTPRWKTISKDIVQLYQGEKFHRNLKTLEILQDGRQSIPISPPTSTQLSPTGALPIPRQPFTKYLTHTPEQAQDMGITLIPQQIQAQGVTLTPQQAQELGITLTPEQLQAQGITLTPQQVQDLGITPTTQQIQAQGITLPPQQIQAQGIILSPQQAQDLGISLTPQQIQAQRISLTPQQAQDLGITLTPQQIQAEGVTLTPQQAQDLGVTLTPQHAQDLGITLTPQQAQDLGITLTPQQIQAQGFTLTPQQAQDLGITLTPQQIQAQGVTLTPQQAQDLGITITLTPQQAQALGITLTPKQIQAQVVTLTPQQAQDLGVTLTPQQIQAQGVTLNPQQAQDLGITLTPQQAQDLGITLTPQQIKAQGVTLTPHQAQDLGITLTPQQIQAQGVTLNPQQAQDLGITLTPQQIQAQGVTLTPQQIQAQGVTLTPQPAQDLGITLTPQQIQAQGVTLTPQQAQDLGITLTPQRIQAQEITLTPQQAQELGITLTPKQIQAQEITLTPQQAQDLGITFTPQQIQAQGVTLTPQQAQDLGITLTPQQIQAQGVTLTPQQAQDLGITLTPKQIQAQGVTLTPQQIQAQGITLTPQQAQELGITFTPQQIQAQGVTLTPQQAQDLGITLTPQQIQAQGVTLTPQQAQAMGVSITPKNAWLSAATITPEQTQALGSPITLEQAQALGVPFSQEQLWKLGVPVSPDKAHSLGSPLTLEHVQPSLRQFQKVKASLPTGQSITSRLSPSAPTAKSSIFGVSSTPLQISRPSLTQAPFAPEISLGLGIPSDSGKLLVPQTLPSSRQTVVYRGRSTHEQFLATEVPPTPGQLPISGATPTLVPLAPRQPLISGVPSISGQIPSLWAPLSPGQPLVPGASSIPGELLESGLSTFSEQSQAFQPPATPEQSPYLQAPSIFKQHLAPRTLPRQASSLWIPPIPMHSPILWASPVSGKPQKGLSSSITSKRLAVISQKSKSALAHPRAPDFEVSQAPFTTKKFQMPGVSDTSEETKLLRETFAMEAFKTLQPHLMDYRTPTLQTPYIDEGALSTLMKPITSLPSLTTQLPQTSQISPSEWDQISRFPPIGKPWILTSVSGIKKPKMMVPPISLQDLEEKRYLVDVQAQRNNLILLNWATKTFGLPSQLHTTARNLIIETLHMDTIRLGYLFHKYIAFRLIQHARNNIIKRIKAIENTGKGYETQNLYIMLSRIDNYQKKVMQVWTEKQKSLEQKRNQCLRKITHLFSQLQEMYKLNLSQPIPLIIDKKHTPASTKFVQWPLLEDRKSDIFKKSRQEDQTEAIWNADLSTSSYPIAEKTSIHSHWAKLGGYPDVPRLLQLDVQSTFRKSLASMQSR
ncbi:protein FAM186A, partial [Cynocephalus volans]|uniref:protein FAM186A n=1 Tax=Cynocephalus volans TaxID=110931 RepID=UPI002FC74DAA